MITKRRRLGYSFSVLGISIVGQVVITALTSALSGEGGSVGDAMNRLAFALAWGWMLTLPLLVIFTGALFLSSLPFRHARWWVGLVAGTIAVACGAGWIVLPGLLMTITGTGSWSYVGTAEEIAAANLRDLVVDIGLAAWCIATAVLCVPLLRGTRRGAPPTPATGFDPNSAPDHVRA